MTPYYEDEKLGVKIYHGDCLDLIRSMSDKSVDSVVTDPPYGVNLEYASYEDSFENWKSLIDGFIPEAKRISLGPIIVPTSKMEGEPHLHSHDPIWRICWFKGASCTRCAIGFKDWEPTYVFGKRPKKQVHDYFMAHANRVRKDIPGHPCPKPEAWGMWMVEKMSEQGQTVLDPFMGSGTTGVACVKLGRKFIGIELEKDYCDIAVNRIREAAAKLTSPN